MQHQNSNANSLNPEISKAHKDSLNPERLPHENYAEYKTRRLHAKAFLKQKRKGSIAWCSKRLMYDKYGNSKGLKIIQGTFKRQKNAT